MKMVEMLERQGTLLKEMQACVAEMVKITERLGAKK